MDSALGGFGSRIPENLCVAAVLNPHVQLAASLDGQRVAAQGDHRLPMPVSATGFGSEVSKVRRLFEELVGAHLVDHSVGRASQFERHPHASLGLLHDQVRLTPIRAADQSFHWACAAVRLPRWRSTASRTCWASGATTHSPWSSRRVPPPSERRGWPREPNYRVCPEAGRGSISDVGVPARADSPEPA